MEWMSSFAELINGQKDLLHDAEVIVCAPYTQLYPLKNKISELGVPVELGAQSVSPYADGAYTGQVSARMIKELASWVIVGHSEWRKYFNESDADLAQVTKQAKTAGLSVIYCVSEADMTVPEGVDIIAYEPLWAIGTGKTDSPENAASVLSDIKSKTGIARAIYGGSVTSENVASFINQPAIDGVLPGGASLDPDKFYHLVIRAISP